ncbi:MAG: TraR/DksA family transcriptional regulator [Planctomycetes bacterium]|nr:TraR/DksA family transcriptional regulator [Planctomycetota bacterium]
MTAVQSETFRRRLTSLRERLKTEIGSHVESVQEKAQPPGEVPTVPTHTADRDTEGLDAEVNLASTQHELLSQVQSALERIEEGEFGRCVDCGGEIAAERLKAIPYAARCVECERKAE